MAERDHAHTPLVTGIDLDSVGFVQGWQVQVLSGVCDQGEGHAHQGIKATLWPPATPPPRSSRERVLRARAPRLTQTKQSGLQVGSPEVLGGPLGLVVGVSFLMREIEIAFAVSCHATIDDEAVRFVAAARFKERPE